MSRMVVSVATLAILAGGASCGSERATPPLGLDGATPVATQPADPSALPGVTEGALPRDTELASGDGAATPSNAASPNSTAGTATEARPASKPGRITIEGFDEWLELDRFETPRGFPLPFTTYAPSDLLAEGSPAAISFVANFGSRRNDAVVLRLLPLAGGVSEGAARESARREAARRGQIAPGEPRRFAWSLAEYPYAGSTPMGPGEGLVAVGRHGERYFMLLLEYPLEYSEGFLPRATRVLQELRWSDTGTGLRPPS